jgi:hypothetical protein
VISGFVVFASMACNGLLGNEEGTPRVASAEGGAPTSDGGGNTGLVCDLTQGNKVCFGLCVKIDQPNTGCGGPSCSACDPKNVVTTACKGGTQTLSCGYDACKSGFDNCDSDLANGCETSLGSKDACGGCGVKCQGITPFCAVTNGTAGCVATCPPGTQECSGACVDTLTSTENCGGCGKKCARASATAKCEGGQCAFACQQGTHMCGESCVSDIDPGYCLQCSPCPAPPPNMTSTCSGGLCGNVCANGYIDCDGSLVNGCEVQGNSCPIINPGNCGGVVCGLKQQCCNGKCVASGLICEGPPPPVPQ